ncbi:MAG: FG-GAP repeat domain-containing protein, partial [bacterium]
MGGSSGRRTGRALLFLPLLSAIIAVIPCPSFSQILENLEIVFQKTYVDGAAPDSLWDWGRSIDCAGDVNNDGYDDIIVAANIETGDPLQPWLGKAYIFLGGNPMDTFPDVILTGSKYGSTVIHVAGVGDFNHDGYDDVIVGQGDGEQGVRVFLGGDPMDTIPDIILQTRPGESVATDVAGAGDVNGDSIADCIVGDYLWAATDGRALIFLGGNIPDGVPDVILNGRDKEGMGISVGGGGDLNWDGFDDVVVGADANSEVALFAGKVYGFFGGGPMDTIPDVWVHGEGPNQSLGWYGVDIAKHDSTYDWLIVGSAFYPNGFPTASRGRIYVMYGDSVM